MKFTQTQAARGISMADTLSTLKSLAKTVKRTALGEPDPASDIHYLHIGKCAGTQVLTLAQSVNARGPKRRILKRSHDVFLKHLPPKVDYFFSIRDPLSRFRSGFYSRKRKGQPRNYFEWSADDAQAFVDFPEANDLAESLFSDGALGAKAWAAMKSIRHVAQNQSDWFYCKGNFLKTRPPLWILRTEHFDKDLKTLLDRVDLGVPTDGLVASDDPIDRHANDYKAIPDLSDKALENLKTWYAQDIAFYQACETWMAQHETP